jgi:hypothetical protein
MQVASLQGELKNSQILKKESGQTSAELQQLSELMIETETIKEQNHQLAALLLDKDRQLEELLKLFVNTKDGNTDERVFKNLTADLVTVEIESLKEKLETLRASEENSKQTIQKKNENLALLTAKNEELTTSHAQASNQLNEIVAEKDQQLILLTTKHSELNAIVAEKDQQIILLTTKHGVLTDQMTYQQVYLGSYHSTTILFACLSFQLQVDVLKTKLNEAEKERTEYQHQYHCALADLSMEVQRVDSTSEEHRVKDTQSELLLSKAQQEISEKNEQLLIFAAKYEVAVEKMTQLQVTHESKREIHFRREVQS